MSTRWQCACALLSPDLTSDPAAPSKWQHQPLVVEICCKANAFDFKVLMAKSNISYE